MEERVWHRSYDRGVAASIDFEDLTVPRFLERSAAQYGKATALRFLNCQLTFQQLKEEVDRFATALAALGVGPGTRVAIHLPNLPQTVIAYYATLSLGGQAVMTNPLYVEREIEHQWNDAGCSVAVTADFLFEGRVKAIRGALPVKHYVIASIPEYLRFPLDQLARFKLKRAHPPLIAPVDPSEDVHWMRKLIRATPPNPPRVEVSMDDVAVLQYTGGTTGVSKGAMLTHRNLSYNVQQVAAWFAGARPGEEVMLAALPYFHVFGMTVVMNYSMYMAAATVLVPNPRDVDQIVKSITGHSVTLFPAVPAMFNAITNVPAIEDVDLRSIKFCLSGAAPLPADVRDRFERITGATIAEGYGLTEASPVTHVNPLEGRGKPGTVGVPVGETDAKIVDLDDGASALPAGRDGELAVRGPQVMKGYWKRPDATDEVLRDGWLYTGDVARVDADGYCYIVGRKKDMIIASGYNVYPDEVDAVLASHPAVLEAATIGVPDDKRGETVKSFIVLAKDRKATADELIDYCRRQLAAYKVPRHIEFRDALPKSTILKVLRRELRDQELAKQETVKKAQPRRRVREAERGQRRSTRICRPSRLPGVRTPA
jgi:long-chain acyl-CoA synthetase